MKRFSILCTVLLLFFAIQRSQADEHEMKFEVLETSLYGPFKIEVMGSRNLLLEPSGDQNLGPYTATAKLTNMSDTELTVSYPTGGLLPFYSSELWEKGDPSPRQSLPTPPGQPGSKEQNKRLAPGESLLLSSWTRHHQAMWRAVITGERLDGQAIAERGDLSRKFLAHFPLALTYKRGTDAPAVLSKSFVLEFVAHKTR